VEENSHAKVLVRVNEVNEFVSKSILQVDAIIRHKKTLPGPVSTQLTPMTLNVHRALEAIGKFHMNHPLDLDP